MANRPPACINRRAFPPASDLRVTRLRFGVRLEDAAREAGLTLTRASRIEREPALAKPEELTRLLDAIPRLAGDGR